MGNLLRGDDGFGVRVVQRLSEIQLPAGTEVYEAGGSGIALAQRLMDGFDACIIADAMLHGGPPGALYCVAPELPEETRALDAHALDPLKVLVLARALGALPPHVVLIGCEPAETEELCERLSPPVEAAVEHAVAMILRELERLAT